MTPTPSFGKNKQHEQGEEALSELLQPPPPNLIGTFDGLSAIKTENAAARMLNRALTSFLFLFALTVPHSIAASQISLGLVVITWIARDITARRFYFARTA